MNGIHNLSTELQEEIRIYTISGNRGRFISCYFMKFLTKLNLKKTFRIYMQCTGQSKIDQPVLFYTGFCPIFSEFDLIFLIE